MTPPPSDYSLQGKFIYFVTNIDSRAAAVAAAGPRGHNILAKKASARGVAYIHIHTQKLSSAALSCRLLARSLIHMQRFVVAEQKKQILTGVVLAEKEMRTLALMFRRWYIIALLVAHSFLLLFVIRLYIFSLSQALCGCVFFACRASVRES
jgi:hypothetical protein